MELEYIHKKEITEHDNGHIHEIVRNQYRGQQSFCIIQQISDFLIRRMFPSSIEFKSDGEKWKNANFGSRKQNRKQAKAHQTNTIAIIAETEGVCTVILLKYLPIGINKRLGPKILVLVKQLER